MEPQVGYRIKLSIDNLRTSDEAFQILKKLVARQKNTPKGIKQLQMPFRKDTWMGSRNDRYRKPAGSA